MVGVLASCDFDHWFELRSSQTKNYNIAYNLSRQY